MDVDELPEDSRPAVVDGKLDVGAGPERTRPVVVPAPFDRWNALAAAVMAQAAFDELGFTREPPIDLD